MKSLVKTLYYAFGRDDAALQDLHLGYVFHTEKIYDNAIFDRLLLFCEAFEKLTGARPICTLIPPTNRMLKKEMTGHGSGMAEFAGRVRTLSARATIGYHGHFYLGGRPAYRNALHGNSFNRDDLARQFHADLAWFDKESIDHHGIYAGGWWFFDRALFGLLVENGFRYDLTFSQAPYFYSPYAASVMKAHGIRPGECFFLGGEGAKLLCIQNLIGMHQTPFPQDFVRNMTRLLGRRKGMKIGVVNAHDDDLDYDNTLKCIRYLLARGRVRFHGFESLVAQVAADARVVSPGVALSSPVG